MPLSQTGVARSKEKAKRAGREPEAGGNSSNGLRDDMEETRFKPTLDVPIPSGPLKSRTRDVGCGDFKSPRRGVEHIIEVLRDLRTGVQHLGCEVQVPGNIVSSKKMHNESKSIPVVVLCAAGPASLGLSAPMPFGGLKAAAAADQNSATVCDPNDPSTD